MKFVPTEILVTASKELEAEIEDDLNNPTFPADPLSVIAENTVAYAAPTPITKEQRTPIGFSPSRPQA